MKRRSSVVAFAFALLLSALQPTVSSTRATVGGDESERWTSPVGGGVGRRVSSVDAPQCDRLPRNAVLASCPAPCLPDAPCIVYDQDAELSKFTGCDYATSNPNSFCFSPPSQNCEFHCFPKSRFASSFGLHVDLREQNAQPKLRTAPDPRLLDQPGDAYASNDFVFSFGRLNLSETISDVTVIASTDPKDPELLVDIDVDPTLLAGAPSVTSLTLISLPLGSARAAAIVASAPPTLTKLNLGNTKFESLSWKSFAPLPHLESLYLATNAISRTSGSDFTMPALKELDLHSNQLRSFELRAPKLKTLQLQYNKLVRIPESVFTYTEIKLLNLYGNPLIRPLVLTTKQLAFLEAVPSLLLKLVDSPDTGLVSRLPVDGSNMYGNYSDDVDISLLLEGATETLLKGDPSLPVRVVDDERAKTYNTVLELRARARAETSGDFLSAQTTGQPATGSPTSNGSATTTPATSSPFPAAPMPTSPPTASPTRPPCPLPATASDDFGSCQDMPRNTLLSSCPAPCLPDAPCIVYDQDATHFMVNGCDYNTSSSESICSIKGSQTQTCEFHCFASSSPKETFGFVVPFKANAVAETLRCDEDPRLIQAPAIGFPFQSNDFVFSVGKLNVSNNIREINISGDSQPGNRDKYVSVDVDPALLAGASSVTTVTLANLPLGNSRVAAVVASAPPTLKTLFLPRTQLTSLSKTLAPMPALEVLSLSENQIALVAENDLNLPSLTHLHLDSNVMTQFKARAPNLVAVNLKKNKLVCIPQSVFTYTKLQSLDLTGNPIVRPLMLTAAQVQFLEALPDLTIDLVDLGDAHLNMDNVDTTEEFKGSKLTYLHGNPLLPVRVAGARQAIAYNGMLERLATYPPPWGLIPPDLCQGLPRNTLQVSYYPCSNGGAWVIYDQDTLFNQISGCDYNVASTSYCTRPVRTARTCEFHCFPAYEIESQFKFFIPFKAPLGESIERAAMTDMAKSSEIPFLSNTFVTKLGSLERLSSINEVMISGGRSERGTRGRVADVSIDTFSYGSSVTTLSLMNIDLSKSDLAVILSRELMSLNVRNTRLTSLPERVFETTPKLKTLILAQNDLTSLDTTTMTLPELKTLDLSENALTTIDIYTPKLKTLDLSGNELVRIPLVVFTLSELEIVYLDGNLFTFPLVLSRTQASFLDSLADVRFVTPTPALAATVKPTVTTTPTTTSAVNLAHPSPGNANGSDPASVIGASVVIKGVSVIIVDESTANQYNDQLEQKQRESPRPRGRSSGDNQSTPTSSPASSSRGDEPTERPSEPATASSSGDVQSPSPTISCGKANSTESTNCVQPRAATGDSSPSLSPTSNEASNSSSTPILVPVSLGSALLVAAVAFVAICRRREKVVKDPTNSESYQTLSDKATEVESIDMDGDGSIVSWWKDDAMLSHRLRASDIGDVRVIGSGGSGVVWLVNYRGGTRKLVAKRLIPGNGPTFDAKMSQLAAEAKIASSLCYPSIVALVGVAWTDKTDLQVLYEYMPNGDLGSYLARTDASTLPWLPDKLQLAINIIEALVYTHSFNPPLLHRDLKSSNVLLDGNFKAKLGDFGCARFESDSNTMTARGVGTGRWLAPEIVSGSTSYGASSDIYSFGVVLSELDTHQVPYAVEAAGVPETILLERVARGELRPSLSSSCPSEIREVAEACLGLDPESRPTAMQVAHTLRSLRQQRWT